MRSVKSPALRLFRTLCTDPAVGRTLPEAIHGVRGEIRNNGWRLATGVRRFSASEGQLPFSQDMLTILEQGMVTIEHRHARLNQAFSEAAAPPDEIVRLSKELSKLEDFMAYIAPLKTKRKDFHDDRDRERDKSDRADRGDRGERDRSERHCNYDRERKAQTLGDNSQMEFMRGRCILEINPNHPIIQDLNVACKDTPRSPRAQGMANLLYETALLCSGFTPVNPAEFGARVYEMMGLALAGKSSASGEEEKAASPGKENQSEEDSSSVSSSKNPSEVVKAS